MQKKILLAEDDERIVKAISVRLNAKGYEVLAAYDAIMAMQKTMEQDPDLILLDINMPGGNGLTLAERLKNSSKTSHIPIIFLTASKQPDLQQRAINLGAIAFFEKPFDFDELLATVRAALDHPHVRLTNAY
ncbi:MAG: response regulator transcription factor [Nitrospirales bacterium]|nr:response regulator transcription factor [Nitrospira sp.]MDR4503081.1 response regulator transcription factor [Nitrospirales bacterium]